MSTEWKHGYRPQVSKDDIRAGELAAGHDVFEVEIAVTIKQCNAIRDYWQHLYEDLGTFSLLGRQCTTAVIESLGKGGVYSRGLGVSAPQDLLKDTKKVKHTCGPNKDKRVKVKQIAQEN